MSDQQHWYSHGKLLLSGEYLVMEGAKAFALPLKHGQHLSLTNDNQIGHLSWEAFHPEGSWFRAEFETEKLTVTQTNNPELAENLSKILQAVQQLSASFLKKKTGYSVQTKLDFNPEFGFGSSSTLISNLAWWAGVSPFELLGLTFGGSGYDIACARIDSPLIYRLTANGPQIEEVSFKPPFRGNIYFVYLGKKQKSQESIRHFKSKAVFGKKDLETISRISEQLLIAVSLKEFEGLLDEHEAILAGILGRPTVKSLLFDDYLGTVKSLGGWGGDFVLLTTGQDDSIFRSDMKKRGFPVVYAYDELVL